MYKINDEDITFFIFIIYWVIKIINEQLHYMIVIKMSLGM